MKTVNDVLNVALGKEMRRIRKSKKISMQQAGEKIGVTKQMIFMYEMGKNPFKAWQYKELCQMYGVDMNKTFNNALKNMNVKLFDDEK